MILRRIPYQVRREHSFEIHGTSLLSALGYHYPVALCRPPETLVCNLRLIFLLLPGPLLSVQRSTDGLGGGFGTLVVAAWRQPLHKQDLCEAWSMC